MNSQQTRSRNDINILIAEDSPTQAQQLQHLLEENGYKVTVAANGKEALALMRQQAPSIVISDIMMPEMDGFTLCKEIKSDKKLKEIPVVLLTSLSSPSEVVQGLQSGADNFLRKPYEGNYLLDRIHQLLTNREVQKTEKIRVGLKIRFQGQEYLITSEPQQVLDLLMSTFEEAVRVNGELTAREQDLKTANEGLEREVAERKRAEAETRKLNTELAAANKELEAFSYSVSHDLRAPLRAIDGFSQALLDDHEERLDVEGRDSLRRVRAAAQHMGMLIDDLLNLSRVTRGEMNMGAVDLSAVALKIAKELRQADPGRLVEFVIEPGLVANGDARLLGVALDNLLRNAWKFTKERSLARIEFGINQDADKPTYFVRDNGAGFEMEYADKLFQPFQRMHSSAEFEGTGIGLATVQRVVNRHGGEVWAAAQKEKGATFYFTLPS
jgi:two-component system sensor histidine kinase/response regulator